MHVWLVESQRGADLQMMGKKKIWKYPVFNPSSAAATVSIEMPQGAKILKLDLDMKDGHPHIWVLVDHPELEMVQRHFVHIGTGFEFDSAGLQYVGTWQMAGFVFHTFESSMPI